MKELTLALNLAVSGIGLVFLLIFLKDHPLNGTRDMVWAVFFLGVLAAKPQTTR